MFGPGAGNAHMDEIEKGKCDVEMNMLALEETCGTYRR